MVAVLRRCFDIWFDATNSCNRVLPEKLTVSQLVKNFPPCYGTRRFITAFLRALNLSLSWARAIQSMPMKTRSRCNYLADWYSLLPRAAPFPPIKDRGTKYCSLQVTCQYVTLMQTKLTKLAYEIFCDVIQRILVVSYRRFGTTCRFRLQGSGTDTLRRPMGNSLPMLPLYAA